MATDIRTSELKSPVDVAEYLFRRLFEVGVRGVHGVPGDYNLVRIPLSADCQVETHHLRWLSTIFPKWGCIGWGIATS